MEFVAVLLIQNSASQRKSPAQRRRSSHKRRALTHQSANVDVSPDPKSQAHCKKQENPGLGTGEDQWGEAERLNWRRGQGTLLESKLRFWWRWLLWSFEYIVDGFFLFGKLGSKKGSHTQNFSIYSFQHISVQLSELLYVIPIRRTHRTYTHTHTFIANTAMHWMQCENLSNVTLCLSFVLLSFSHTDTIRLSC